MRPIPCCLAALLSACAVSNEVSDTGQSVTLDTIKFEGSMYKGTAAGARWHHEIYHNPNNDNNEWRSWIEFSNKTKYLRKSNDNKGIKITPVTDPCDIDPDLFGCEDDGHDNPDNP